VSVFTRQLLLKCKVGKARFSFTECYCILYTLTGMLPGKLCVGCR